jgi:hypothetical protein
MLDVVLELVIEHLPVITTALGALVMRRIEKNKIYKRHKERIDELLRDLRDRRDR